MTRRLPLPAGSSRGELLSVHIDGRPVQAYSSEMVSAVLLAEGVSTFRHTRQGDARAIFCGMGVCFDCLVVVDGVPNTRACMTRVQDGMEIRTQEAFHASGEDFSPALGLG